MAGFDRRYFGVPPATQMVLERRYPYTAEAGQTEFPAEYTIGHVDVYYNGIHLDPRVSFTGTDGQKIVLTEPAIEGATVVIVSRLMMPISDALTTYDLERITPAGMIAYFPSQTAPEGWLKANGAAVSRVAYSRLFERIGTMFGDGDGSTTFNLPDLRGEFIRGWDDGRGLDTGRQLGSIQESQNLSHNHTGSTTEGGAHSHVYSRLILTLTSSGSADLFRGSASDTGGYFISTQNNATNSVAAHTHGLTINASGGAEARPRNVALLACIKY